MPDQSSTAHTRLVALLSLTTALPLPLGSPSGCIVARRTTGAAAVEASALATMVVVVTAAGTSATATTRAAAPRGVADIGYLQYLELTLSPLLIRLAPSAIARVGPPRWGLTSCRRVGVPFDVFEHMFERSSVGVDLDPHL